MLANKVPDKLKKEQVNQTKMINGEPSFRIDGAEMLLEVTA